MDGLYGKAFLKWMIWGYHHLRKHPYTTLVAENDPPKLWTVFSPGMVQWSSINFSWEKFYAEWMVILVTPLG